MPNSSYVITALPVVVPLGLVAFAILLWRLYRAAALAVPRAAVLAVLCVYGAGVVANTVLPITVGGPRYAEPWQGHLNLTLLVNTDTGDMLQNVAVFMPLGFLLPLVSRVEALRQVLLCGFLVSLAMEAVQFANALLAVGGHVADINDLLANTLGAPLGYGLFRAALLVPGADRMIRAAAWPARSREEARV